MTHPHSRKHWKKEDRSRRGFLRSQARTGTWPLLPHAIGKGSPKAAQIQEFGKQIPAVAASGVDTWRGSKPGSFLQSTCYPVQLRASPGHS